MFKKIVPVSKLPIDARPKMSISWKTYDKVLRGLRKKAKREKRKLITNDGVEDYSIGE